MSSNESVPEIGKTKIAGFNYKIEITNMCEGPITVDFTVDSEAKLLVSILKFEVSELQRKEEKPRKTIEDLESERLRLLVSMTKFDMVAEKSFGEDLEHHRCFGHILRGMKSSDYCFARKKIDFTNSDFE